MRHGGDEDDDEQDDTGEEVEDEDVGSGFWPELARTQPAVR